MTLAILVFLILAAGGGVVALRSFMFDMGSYDYSGRQLTPQVLAEKCPAYVRIDGARVERLKNGEGIDGGLTTIKLELPANRLRAFLDGSPFKEVVLDSDMVPMRFTDPSLMSSQHYYELQNGHAFSTGRIKKGEITHIILIDRTRLDVLVIYLERL